jgi:hypothetical protein
MAVLSATTITRAGVDTAGAAAGAAGDSFTNTGQEFLLVKNSHVSASRTVTLDIKATIDGLGPTDPTVTVAAGIEKIIGPFTNAYNHTDGRVYVTYSDSAADLTVKLIKCTPA